jgi:hypothetical protein
MAALAEPPQQKPIAEEPAEQPRHHRRLPQVELCLKAIMDHRQHRDRIDEPVQQLPALAAEPADDAIGRGRGERRETEQRGKADRQIDPVHDLARDLGEIERLTRDVETEMDQDIGKSGDADHPPHQDQAWPCQNLAQRRDR